MDLVNALGLCNVVFYDVPNTDLDPLDETAIQESAATIDENIRFAKGLSGYKTLKRRGEELLRRLHKVGTQWEPELIAVGAK